MVKLVETKEEFDEIIKTNARVAVDFTASWCGPCKMIGPKFEAMAKDYPEIMFIKVDVDENADTAEAYEIQAMPTFRFFLNNAEVKDLGVVGASEAKIKASLDKLKSS